MNDLDTIAPVTAVERKRQQRLFRSRSSNRSCPQDNSSCPLSATAMLRIRFVHEFQETYHWVN